MYEYVGSLHMHSLYSDGSGDVRDIANTANEVGLDFIILTDHNTLRALDEGCEGWYGNTLLLVGCEINDRENKNHYLAFGIEKPISTRMPAAEYVKKVKEAGGIGFLAHPHEKRSSMEEHPPYPWVDWDVEGFTGIEIWNHMSEWMEGLTEENKYNYFIHPLRSIVKPPDETLEVWDELSLKRKVVGIGGIDAHAHKVNLLGFFEVEVFPYKILFKSVRTHVLLETEIKPDDKKATLDNAKSNIYKSLEQGKCFVTNFYHGDAKGFRFTAKSGTKIFQMGDSVELLENLQLEVTVPIEGEIRILHNGKVVERTEGNSAIHTVKQSGAFRVEVYLNDKAWIFSNHIRIGL
ncbi:MAG: PHP domain-containing protein [Melioribacteraceae bacterium]|nr:PHP domain-containing protein [Melioribacteraceae bacterium]MCF8263651.1 PHP domain-containing protein [Melioribacteraceae bacterium]MCF8431437.1 PHP domain-containing protein [Melioribacteraceae bacterium]